jgi:hypothetical protein
MTNSLRSCGKSLVDYRDELRLLLENEQSRDEGKQYFKSEFSGPSVRAAAGKYIDSMAELREEIASNAQDTVHELDHCIATGSLK